MSNLRELREAAGMKQAELAEKLRTSRANVNRWESGARRLTAEIAALIDEKTEGKISKRDLRPDLFGDAA